MMGYFLIDILPPLERLPKVVSVFSIWTFKFLGFVFGKEKNGAHIRVHAKSMKKANAKPKKLTFRG